MVKILNKIRLYIAIFFTFLAVLIVNKKTLEGFGLAITLQDWIKYCNYHNNKPKVIDKKE